MNKKLLHPLFYLHNEFKKDKKVDDFYYRAYIGDEVERLEKIIKKRHKMIVTAYGVLFGAIAICMLADSLF